MSRECMYYRWNSGYYCDLKYQKNGNGDITDYEVNHYCWYGREDDCPLYKNRNGSGGCFLTSACVEAKGFPDDCDELQTLRHFRDEYMAKLPNGSQEVAEYYQIAPQIVDAINTLPNHKEIWEAIYSKLVIPCVRLIKAGDYQSAYCAYKRAVMELRKKYIKEE